MSDFFDDEYDDEPNAQAQSSQQGGPKALRDAYESEKKARQALEERLATLEKADRQAKLASALKGTGVSNPEALGEFANLIDPDKAGDFVSAVKAAMGIAGEEQPQGVSAEDLAAVAAVSGEPAGTAPTVSASNIESLSGIDNEADFWATMRGQK